MNTEMKNTLQQLPELQQFEISKTPILACRAITRELVALRPIVENLQLKWNNELNKLKSYYSPNQLLYAKSIGADGKTRTMVCLSIGDFNDWLWRLDPQGDKADLDLLNEYRKTLVLQLMMMLKVSLDEVQKLRNYEGKLLEMQQLVNQYTSTLERAQTLRNESAHLFREAKTIKEKMGQVASSDIAQLNMFAEGYE